MSIVPSPRRQVPRTGPEKDARFEDGTGIVRAQLTVAPTKPTWQCLIALLLFVLASCQPNRVDTPHPGPATAPPGLSVTDAAEKPTVVTPAVDEQAYMRAWLAGEMCRPPCFLDIVPGETSIEEALTRLQARPEATAVGTYYDGNSPEVLKAIDWHWQGYPDTIAGTVAANLTTHRVSMITTGFPGESNLELDDVIQAYGEPSHVLAEAHRGTDTPDVSLWLEVVWLDQGLALSWRRGAFDVDTSLDAIDYHPAFFVPTLDGYAALWGFPIVLEQLTPWRGVKSFGAYCTNCVAVMTATP